MGHPTRARAEHPCDDSAIYQVMTAMKLYTKRGDDGTTDLIGGSRVSKDTPRVIAYGDVDETNSAIGLALATCANNDMIFAILRPIQSDLFSLGAELADPRENGETVSVTEASVKQLEVWIDEASAKVAPLKQFVLPGGSELAARLHMARTVSRRAERSAVSLAGVERVRPTALIYLNRLSDLLFALARLANLEANVEEIPWQPPKR